MGRGTIALYTQDSRYANAFADYCGRSEQGRLTVKIFTNGESLQNYIEGHNVDLLLVEKVLFDEHLKMFNTNVALLSDEKYIDETAYPVIFRLQRIDDVFRQIYEVMAENMKTGKYVFSNIQSRVDIIGVFSPCYELEREQFAREVAKVYADAGEKVLFINMATLTEYDIETGEGISELIYYLREEGNAITYKLSALVRSMENYMALSGVRHYKDLYEMTGADIERMFYELIQMGGYTKIIVDIGFVINIFPTVLDFCKLVWMPYVNIGKIDMRMEHLWHDFRLEDNESALHSFNKMELPKWWRGSPGLRKAWVEEQVM